MACGSSNSGAPSSPGGSTFTLTGQITDTTTGKGVSGATVLVADGPNASKSASTDISGNYSLAGLQLSGFTVNASASNYTSQARGVTLTSNQTLSFQLAPFFANVAGTWSGTMQYLQVQASTGTNAQSVQNFTMTLTQSGASVSGTWTATNGTTRTGTVSGTTNQTSFSGSFTYNSTSTTGTPCTGTLAVTGTVGLNTITWTSPLVNENCNDAPTNITFGATR